MQREKNCFEELIRDVFSPFPEKTNKLVATNQNKNKATPYYSLTITKTELRLEEISQVNKSCISYDLKTEKLLNNEQECDPSFMVQFKEKLHKIGNDLVQDRSVLLDKSKAV